MRRLATVDWFTSRISACGLFATAYPRGAEATKAEYVEEPLKYIQCSEICTLINEKFHTET